MYQPTIRNRCMRSRSRKQCNHRRRKRCNRRRVTTAARSSSTSISATTTKITCHRRRHRAAFMAVYPAVLSTGRAPLYRFVSTAMACRKRTATATATTACRPATNVSTTRLATAPACAMKAIRYRCRHANASVRHRRHRPHHRHRRCQARTRFSLHRRGCPSMFCTHASAMVT